MCGIIGYVPLVDHPPEYTREAFELLFKESCIRGLHAYGLADSLGGTLNIYRSHRMEEIINYFTPAATTIAHARYCQSGDYRVMENNQPIVVDNMALAMNGVISMGTKEEYETEFDVTCSVDNDSEIFLRKIVDAQTPEDVLRKAEEFVGSIQGSFAGTFIAKRRLFAGRNSRRPLWKCVEYGAKWYASTEDIFHRAGFSGAEPVPVGFEVA